MKKFLYLILLSSSSVFAMQSNKLQEKLSQRNDISSFKNRAIRTTAVGAYSAIPTTTFCTFPLSWPMVIVGAVATELVTEKLIQYYMQKEDKAE
jgi:hypothetical protein